MPSRNRFCGRKESENNSARKSTFSLQEIYDFLTISQSSDWSKDRPSGVLRNMHAFSDIFGSKTSRQKDNFNEYLKLYNFSVFF